MGRRWAFLRGGRGEQAGHRLTRPALQPPADISELDLPKNVSIRFPEGKDKIMNFEITLKPDEGIYKCARGRARGRRGDV